MLQVASGDVARQQQHATMTLCVPISFVQEFVTVFFSPPFYYYYFLLNSRAAELLSQIDLVPKM